MVISGTGRDAYNSYVIIDAIIAVMDTIDTELRKK